jgi:hypothetical protein
MENKGELKMKRKLDGMLLATFITTLFYSASYPFINKVIISNVSETFIALSQIINCISVVFFGFIWNKFSHKLFKFYPAFCIFETLLSIMSTLVAVTTGNILAYYIMDTLIFAIVTRNICCGGVKLRTLRYNTEAARECFDNNNNSANAIATIIGSAIAIVLKLDFITMLWIATIGNAIDNIFYIVIYIKTKKR